MFANTCAGPTAAATVAALTAAPHTCDNVGLCVGTLTGSSCAWNRKLCVSCTDVSGTIYVRVQSNGLPNHCYYSPNIGIMELDIDFQVKFNVDVTNNIFNSANSQTDINNLICDNKRTKQAYIPTVSDYTQTGATNIDKAGGIATSGVLIYNGVMTSLMDPFYVTPYNYYTLANMTLAK